MEALLVNLLVAVIVFGIVAGVVKLAEGAGVVPGWMAQAALLIVGGVFLIYLLVRVLLPLVHTSGVIG